MNEYIISIDGGTSNTRLRLLKDGVIIDSIKIPMGAGSSSDDSKNNNLEERIKISVNEIIEKHHCEITCFLSSGMITSTIGLINIPHLQAPFKTDEIKIKPVYFNNIHKAPFYFIPGIKFIDKSDDFLNSDMAKGEETEVYGILGENDYNKKILILHFGTHNKAISVLNGEIVSSITTIGGELLNAICTNTILKNSICEFDSLYLEEDYVLKGFEYANSVGLSRSLFLGRVGQVIYSMTENQVFSFIYGILVSSDFSAFKHLFNEQFDKIIIYGREEFSTAFNICFLKMYSRYSDILSKISYEESELLSTKGLYNMYVKNRGNWNE